MFKHVKEKLNKIIFEIKLNSLTYLRHMVFRKRRYENE